jgi:membrane-associated phospholipid phosphatase
MDLTLLTFFNLTLAQPLLDGFMLFVTYGGLALLPGLGLIWLFGKQRRIGLALLTVMTISLALTLLLQYTALRPRPEGVRLLFPTPNFPSYPSGHAALAFAAAVVLALTYRRWGWLILSGAGLIALSRVYLGYHYPSDIMGGAMLGAGLGAAGYGLMIASPTGQPAWRWLLWPQIALMGVISQLAYLDLLHLRFLRWPLVDKSLHFVLFGLAVFWLNLWFEGRMVNWRRWGIPLALLVAISIASSEEVAQAWSAVRTASWLDWSSDMLGMLFFWWLSCQAL